MFFYILINFVSQVIYSYGYLRASQCIKIQIYTVKYSLTPVATPVYFCSRKSDHIMQSISMQLTLVGAASTNLKLIRINPVCIIPRQTNHTPRPPLQIIGEGESSCRLWPAPVGALLVVKAGFCARFAVCYVCVISRHFRTFVLAFRTFVWYNNMRKGKPNKLNGG